MASAAAIPGAGVPSPESMDGPRYDTNTEDDDHCSQNEERKTLEERYLFALMVHGLQPNDRIDARQEDGEAWRKGRVRNLNNIPLGELNDLVLSNLVKLKVKAEGGSGTETWVALSFLLCGPFFVLKPNH